MAGLESKSPGGVVVGSKQQVNPVNGHFGRQNLILQLAQPSAPTSIELSVDQAGLSKAVLSYHDLSDQ